MSSNVMCIKIVATFMKAVDWGKIVQFVTIIYSTKRDPFYLLELISHAVANYETHSTALITICIRKFVMESEFRVLFF